MSSPGAEVISKIPAFDPIAFTRENIGGQIKYYQHPLAAELRNFLDAHSFLPTQEADLVATQGAFNALVTEEVENARERFCIRVERDYPVKLVEDQPHLPELLSLTAPTDIEPLISGSKQELLKGVNEAVSPVKTISSQLDPNDIQETTQSLRQAHENNVRSQVEYIAQTLILKHGALGSFVMNMLFRNYESFQPFSGKNIPPNIHRSLNSLLQSLRLLSSPEALGQEVAETLFADAKNEVRQITTSQCLGLARGAIRGLSQKLSDLVRSRSADITRLAVTELTIIGTVSSANSNSSPSQGVESSLPSAPAGVKTNHYREERDAFSGSENKEVEPLAIGGVGIGKKLGGKTSSTYAVELLTTTEQNGNKLDAYVRELMGIKLFRQWFRRHPDTKNDVNNLLRGLLLDNNMTGTEQITDKILSVYNPSTQSYVKVPARRLSPSKANKVGEKGFESPHTQKLRIYYFVAEIGGKRVFAIYKAGNKADYDHKLSKHM